MSVRPAVKSLLSVGWWPIILSFLLGIVGCSEGPLFATDGNIRKVDGRPTPQTRTSLKKVRNDLYNYVNGGHLDFRVRPEPPLSFVFPSAYYTYDVNHVGGAVSLIGLEVDLTTFGPFSRAPVVRRPDAKTPPADARESHIRDVSITIESNYFTDADDYLKRGVFRQAPAFAENAHEAAIISGYRVMFYQSVQDRALSEQTPILVGDLDIANTSLYAIPVNATKSLVQQISCNKVVPRCRASFVYSGRLVDVVFDKSLFAQVTDLVLKTENLLDRHRV